MRAKFRNLFPKTFLAVTTLQYRIFTLIHLETPCIHKVQNTHPVFSKIGYKLAEHKINKIISLNKKEKKQILIKLKICFSVGQRRPYHAIFNYFFQKILFSLFIVQKKTEYSIFSRNYNVLFFKKTESITKIIKIIIKIKYLQYAVNCIGLY